MSRRACSKIGLRRCLSQWCERPQSVEKKLGDIAEKCLSLHLCKASIFDFDSYCHTDVIFEDPFVIIKGRKSYKWVWDKLEQYVESSSTKIPEIFPCPQLIGSERNTFANGIQICNQIFISSSLRYSLKYFPCFNTVLSSTIVLTLNNAGKIIRHEDRWFGHFINFRTPVLSHIHRSFRTIHGKLIDHLHQ